MGALSLPWDSPSDAAMLAVLTGYRIMYVDNPKRGEPWHFKSKKGGVWLSLRDVNREDRRWLLKSGYEIREQGTGDDREITIIDKDGVEYTGTGDSRVAGWALEEAVSKLIDAKRDEIMAQM